MDKMTFYPDLGDGLFIAGNHIGSVANGFGGLSRHELAVQIARRWNAAEEAEGVDGPDPFLKADSVVAEAIARSERSASRPSAKAAQDAVAMTREYRELILATPEEVERLVSIDDSFNKGGFAPWDQSGAHIGDH